MVHSSSLIAKTIEKGGKFAFEDLEVWKNAIIFANKIIDLIDLMNTDRKHYRLLEQLESSSASIAMNIAEGKGRYSKKEFIQYLYISRGSLNETITLLILFGKREWISESQLNQLKEDGVVIGKQLSSLIQAIKQSL